LLKDFRDFPLLKCIVLARHWWLPPIILPGGRDQEDCGSKPAGQIVLSRAYLEKTLHKNGGGGGAGLVKSLKV
jgi:hypothetical protein